MAIETLQIVPYDPAWPAAFVAERERIAGVLGDLALRIDHHGSTSVQGLAAKPILDIQVSVRRLHPIEGYGTRLGRLGWFNLLRLAFMNVFIGLPAILGFAIGRYWTPVEEDQP